jgi:hypothetical protein
MITRPGSRSAVLGLPGAQRIASIAVPVAWDGARDAAGVPPPVPRGLAACDLRPTNPAVVARQAVIYTTREQSGTHRVDDPPTPEEQDVPEQQFGSALFRKIAESILGRLVETLPVRVARNLVKAVEVTLVGGVGIWEEQLASWRAGIKAKSDARAEAWLAAGQAAGEAVKGDPELGVRAAHSLLGNAIKDQQRREDVVKYTAQALHDDPPAKDAHEDIDEDWLLLFTRVAERISKRDLQEILGRMLAGEIKKPGTFSPFTLQIMTTLTPDIANTFQRAANLSVAFGDGHYSILTAPFRDDGSNALA